MTDDDSAKDRVIRRVVRRARGLSYSSANVSDSTAGARNVSEEIAALEHTPADGTSASVPEPVSSAGTGDEFNPADRLEQVRSRASDYEREYRLDLLHRLLIRKVPIDEIAVQLDISVRQVTRDRAELAKRLRETARGLDIDELIGDSKGFYEEAAAMSMRAASNASAPLPIRLAAIRTGLAAKNDMHRFFQTAGVYDVLRFRKGHDGSTMSDVRRIMENTERLLSGLSAEDGDTGDDETIEL